MEKTLPQAQQETVKVLNELEKSLNLLDPKSGSLETDELLRKVHADARSELNKMQNELGGATTIAELEAIQRKCLDLINKAEQVAGEFYEKKKAEFSIKQKKEDDLHNTAKLYLMEDLPGKLDLYDPKKNGGITSEAFGAKVGPLRAELSKLEDLYGGFNTTASYDQKIGYLDNIVKKCIELESKIDALVTEYVQDIHLVADALFVKGIESQISNVGDQKDYQKDVQILAVIPGEDDSEKKWNYRLLAVYSQIFQTHDIVELKPTDLPNQKPGIIYEKLVPDFVKSAIDWGVSVKDSFSKGISWTAGPNKETISLLGSLRKAAERKGNNGPDVKNRQGVFTDKTKINPQLDQKSSADELVKIATSPNTELAQHLSEIAQYANDISVLVPIYTSLVQEHYLTLLVKRDRTNNNKDGRKNLPKSLQTRYDQLYDTNDPKTGKADPEKNKTANTFTQEGLDSDGIDWTSGPDQFLFVDEQSKMQFLTSSMKLLPAFDNVDGKYIDTELGNIEKIFAGLGDMTELGATTLNRFSDIITTLPRAGIINMLGEGGQTALGILASLRHPNAWVLGRLLDIFNLQPEEERWDNLPLMLMIFQLIRQTRFIGMAISYLRSGVVRLGSGPLNTWTAICKVSGLGLQMVEKILGGDGLAVGSELFQNLTRVAADREFDIGDNIRIRGENALAKLSANPKLKARYDVLIKIIDARIAAGEGKTCKINAYDPTNHHPKEIEVSGVSADFGGILKKLVLNEIQEEYCMEALSLRGKSTDAMRDFNDTTKPNGFYMKGGKLRGSPWPKMIDYAFAPQEIITQLRTGNIPDASRLENGFFARAFHVAGNTNKTDGTNINWLRAWYNGSIGIGMRQLGWRGLPLGAGQSRDSYHSVLSGTGIFLARGSGDRAGAYLDQLAHHLPETMKVEFIDGDTIHHDVEALEKYGYKLNEDDTFDTVHFDQANEKKLLKNCHFTGQFPKNGWKFAVITMVVMARGSKGDLANDHVPTSLDDGHHHFDLKKCADAYDGLSETDKKSVDALFNKILPPNHGVPQKVDRAELMKLGKILGILPSIAGAVDGIDNSGKARTEISRLESIYFKIGEVGDDAQMTTDFMSGYEKCFRDHAKEFGAGYEPDNHVKMIHATRATLCYMHRELMAEVESGKVTTEAKIQEKIKEYVKKKGTHMIDNWYTQHPTAKVEYDKILKKLIDKSLDVQSMATDKDTQLKSLEGRIRGGSMRTDDAVKAEIDRIVADLTDDQKKSLAEKMGIPEDKRKTAKSAVDALKTRYIDDLNTKIQSLHTSIQNPASIADTKELVRRLKTYRCYPHSCETGRADVQMAYAELANRLQALINNPKEYYSLYEHLNNSSFNPESGAAADPDSQNRLDVAYNSVLETGKKKTDEFKNEAKKAIKKATDDLQKVFKKTYADIAALRTALDTAKQNFEQALESVENKFGVDLCMEGGTNKIEEAEESKQKATDTLDAIEKSAGEAQALFTRIQGGSLKTETKISDAIAAFERDPLNQAYRVCFGTQFNTMMETAKRIAEDARQAARTPNVPPPPPEIPPQNPSENPNEVLKNEMALLETTKAYKDYQSDSANNDKYDALMLEMSQGKYSNLRACYRCADRVIGNDGLNKYSPVQILTMLKTSTIDASGTVILALPGGDTISQVELESVFGGNISPVGLMMRMDMSGIGRSSLEVRTTGTNNEKFELHIHR